MKQLQSCNPRLVQIHAGILIGSDAFESGRHKARGGRRSKQEVFPLFWLKQSDSPSFALSLRDAANWCVETLCRPKSKSAFHDAIRHNFTPNTKRLRRHVCVAIGIVFPLDAGDAKHGTCGGSFHSIVGAS